MFPFSFIQFIVRIWDIKHIFQHEIENINAMLAARVNDAEFEDEFEEEYEEEYEEEFDVENTVV